MGRNGKTHEQTKRNLKKWEEKGRNVKKRKVTEKKEEIGRNGNKLEHSA